MGKTYQIAIKILAQNKEARKAFKEMEKISKGTWDKIGKNVKQMVKKSRAALAKMQNTVKSLAAKSKKFFKWLGIGAVAGIAALTAAIFKTTQGAIEWEDAQAALNAVLKSTNSIAGVTAEMAIGLSASYQTLTKFSNGAILSAQNILLTFTKIGKEIFPEVLGLVLDVSTALGVDLKSSAIQLGKALNDPILGMSALSRSGITFTESQKEVVKQLVETGDKLGAQKIILEELQTQFGGAAKAAAETFGGSLVQLKNKFDDVLKAVGAFFSKNEAGKKIINDLSHQFEILETWVSNNTEDMKKMVTDGILAMVNSLLWVGEIIFKIRAAWRGWSFIIAKSMEAVASLMALISKEGSQSEKDFNRMRDEAAAWVKETIQANLELEGSWSKLRAKVENYRNEIAGANAEAARTQIFRRVVDGTLELSTTPFPEDSFAGGINRVPRDMNARIHKNEQIVPASRNPFNPNRTTNDNRQDKRQINLTIINNGSQGGGAINPFAAQRILDRMELRARL